MLRIFVAAMVPLALAACQAIPVPEPLTGADPADQQSGIRDTGYRSVLGDYDHREPVDPKRWRDLNDKQAPGGGGAS